MDRRLRFSITDLWKGSTHNGSHGGKRFRVRVWDRQTKSRRSFLFDTHEEAEAKGREQAALYQLGLDSAAPAKLSVLGNFYLAKLGAKGDDPRHIAQCKQAIDSAIAAGCDDMRSDVFPERIEGWMSSMTKRSAGEEAEPASPALKKKMLGFIKSVCRFAVQRRKLPYNPLDVVESPRVPRARRETWTIPELRTLLSDSRSEDDWQLYVALMVYTGARPSEAKEISWDMIHWDGDGHIAIPEILQGNKTKQFRAVPLQPELRELLRDRAQVSRAPIVSKAINELRPDELVDGIKGYIDRCGLSLGKRQPRHAFRHTFASIMSAMDLSPFTIMEMMGHQETSTAKHYAANVLSYRAEVQAWPKGVLCIKKTPAEHSAAKRSATGG